VFATSCLLVIQFCLKNDTKYLNFLLTPYIDLVYSTHAQRIARPQIRRGCISMYHAMTFLQFYVFRITYFNKFYILESVMMGQLIALIAQYLHISMNAFHVA